MTDFIGHTKLPGMFIAKASMSKYNFDALLQKDAQLQAKLKEIGYLVKLNPTTNQSLTSELTDEATELQTMRQNVEKRAEVFSTILKDTFGKVAYHSKFDTEVINTIAQILFIWDEFIDFADYQKTGDATKIRESVFYKAATEIMQGISDDELERLKSLDIDTHLFEDALNRLKVQNGNTRFTADQSYTLMGTLEKTGLTKPEMVFFLLVIESSLFMFVAEKLMSLLTNIQAHEWRNVDDVQAGIEKAKAQFNLPEDELEHMLDREAEILVLKLDKNIFA